MKLEIPENIPLRMEFFRGFGLPELLRSAVVMAAYGIGAWMYCKLGTSPFRYLTVLFGLVAAVIICHGLFTKQNSNQSIYDYLSSMIKFARSQKRFNYVRKEEMIFETEEQR